MTVTRPADPPARRRVGREGVTASLLARAAAAADAVAAAAPHALEHLLATAEELDAVLGDTLGDAGDHSTGASPLSRDELGDVLVTLSAAGLSAGERGRLAAGLAARLRATRPAPDPGGRAPAS